MPVEARIPGSTRVLESRVIPAPIDRVWETVRPLQFKWLKTVKEAKVQEGKDAEVGSQRRVAYKDGAVQIYKLVELSDLEYSLAYEVISSEPALSVSSVVHQIKLRRVTHDNSTLVEWSSDYANDVTQAVLQDSKYKKLEALEDLVGSVGSQKRKDVPASAPSSPKKAKN